MRFKKLEVGTRAESNHRLADFQYDGEPGGARPSRRSGRLKDACGMPAMRVTYKDHPDDLANARFLQDRAVEILDAAGALRVTRAPVTEQTSHE